MNRGLYIAGTSLMTNQKRLEVLANNLANVNTKGFKKDFALTESFPEVLISKIGSYPNRDTLGGNEIIYETEGEIHSAYTPNGYFVVETPMGPSYVKGIRFIIDDEGYLKTQYKSDLGEYKTDVENYLTDGRGNLLAAVGDMEELLQGIVYYPNPRVIGTMNGGVKFQKIVTDFTQGEIIETSGTFDLALSGPGFFKIQGDDGEIYYTRDGSFTINNSGELVTSDGRQVLGFGGPIIINGEDLTITPSGQVIVDGVNVGTLEIVDINNKEFLRKVGDNYYRIIDGEVAEEVAFEGEVLQGYLEGSNVNSINEMVEMITLLRNQEACQKAIRVQDEMLEKSANEIGRV